MHPVRFIRAYGTYYWNGLTATIACYRNRHNYPMGHPQRRINYIISDALLLLAMVAVIIVGGIL